MILNNLEVTEEKRNKNIPRNKWQWKYNSKPMRSKSSSKREFYRYTSLSFLF